MARGNKHPVQSELFKQRRIQKGEVRNPNGARAHNEDLRRIRRLTNEELAQMGSLITLETFDRIEQLAQDKTAPALVYWLANILVKNAMTGNIFPLDTLLNRVVGKVPDIVNLNANNTTRVAMTPEKLQEELDKAKTFLLTETLGLTNGEKGNSEQS